jgi:hypothetical protein
MITPTTTTAAGTSTGTRLAPALEQKLVGSDPLLDVVAWYIERYDNDLSIDERYGLEGNPDTSIIEDAVVAVHLSQSNPGFCAGCRCRETGGDKCVCLAMLREARAVARRASDRVVYKPQVEDLARFEMHYNLLRRYIVKEIKDRRIHGDTVAVEKCRGVFLLLCEQSSNVAEEDSASYSIVP